MNSATGLKQPVGDPKLFQTISQLTQDYRAGAYSPVEIVELALQQLDRWEPQLNAFISVYGEEALAQAREAEKMYAADRSSTSRGPTGVGPLTGVPIALKDLVDVAGKHTTCGSPIRKYDVSQENADVWKNLRDAGAILLGKTNLLEFAYGVPHPDFGQTNNPYDLTRTSGGSSGGSAAAVAVGVAYGAVGSDTGGSIRIPASYCGVVGVKPTWGWVSERGIFPLSPALDHVGPLARTVQDAAVMMDAMLGNRRRLASGPLADFGFPHGWNPGVSSFAEAMEAPSGVHRVGILPDRLLRYTQPEVKQVYREVLLWLEQMGVDIVELTDTQQRMLEMSERVLMEILLPEAAYVHRSWSDREEDYAVLTWEQLVKGRALPAVTYLQALEGQRSFRRELGTWFEQFDVIALPTVDFPAPQEDPAIGDESADEMRYTGPFNVSGQPAVSVVGGTTPLGLPIGVQFAGKWFRDAQLLAFAGEFEASRIAADGH